VASSSTEFLGYIEGKALEMSEIATIVFVVWFFLAWNSQLMEVLVALSHGRNVIPQRCASCL
jgi:hypothetical protein